VILAGSLEYALSRLHARLSRRLDPAAWSGIERSRETGPVLDLVRGTNLASLAGPLAAVPDLHGLDRACRDAWRALLGDACRWMPASWYPAIAWCGALACLPALGHLAGGEAVPAWMASDPDLAAVAKASPEERRAVLAQGPLAPFAAAWPDRSRLGTAWLVEWRRRLPRGEFAGTALEEFTGLVAGHLARLADPQVPASARHDEAFDAAVTRRLRRHPLEPTAVFAWLALGALDIQRLRGEMARRIALPLARPVP